MSSSIMSSYKEYMKNHVSHWTLKKKPAYLSRAHFLLHRFQLGSVTSGLLITGYKMVIITIYMRVTASPLHSCVAQGLAGQTHPWCDREFILCELRNYPKAMRWPLLETEVIAVSLRVCLNTPISPDRLCGLLVRVPGYRSRDPGFDSQCYQIFWEIVGLERGPLSLVNITEELFGWKSRGSDSRKPRLTTVGICCADHATPSIRKSWN
jgi:hypothetical protein